MTNLVYPRKVSEKYHIISVKKIVLKIVLKKVHVI